jgi:hypothetical protein
MSSISPIRPDPPVSQSLAEIADPWYGLSTHPDIIKIMWKLDNELPPHRNLTIMRALLRRGARPRWLLLLRRDVNLGGFDAGE